MLSAKSWSTNWIVADKYMAFLDKQLKGEEKFAGEEMGPYPAGAGRLNPAHSNALMYANVPEVTLGDQYPCPSPERFFVQEKK